MDPYSIIADRLQQFLECNSYDNVEYDSLGEEAYFKENFDKQNLQEIPLLTKDNYGGTLKPNSLVRYIGVVMDSYDVEYFPALHFMRNDSTQELRAFSSKYCDVLPVLPQGWKFDSEYNCNMLERSTFLCHPVSYMTIWASSMVQSTQKFSNKTFDNFNQPNVTNKRRLEIVDECDDESYRSTKSTVTDFDSRVDKRNSPPHKHLSGGEIDCLVRLYNRENLLSHQLIEVVGILTIDLSTSDDFCDDFDACNALPSASTTPRVQALYVRKLGSSFPLYLEILSNGIKYVSKPYSDVVPLLLMERVNQLDLMKCRETFIEGLSFIIGDSLAAEYILLSILSNINFRQAETILGYLTVVIGGFQHCDDRVSACQQFLSSVVSKLQFIDTKEILDVDLNIFKPHRDYEKNYVNVSPLQVCEGTVVLFSDDMNQVEIDNDSHEKFEIMTNFICKQSIAVRYGMYSLNRQMNSSCLILSTSTSHQQSQFVEALTACSQFPKHSIFISVNNHCSFENCNSWNNDIITSIREYITLVRQLDTILPDSTAQLAEKSFLAFQNPSDKESKFHRQLTLARLIAISEGQQEVSVEHWNRMIAMEESRESRMSN